MHTTGWSRGLEVSGGGQGVVSHAGLVLLRHLADKTGLTGGLSRALATPRFLVHDRGRVMADLACAVADGARVISDFRVMSDQRELFGLVASVPTAWRTLAEIARGGARADRRITAAVNTARRHAWAQVAARHGALPGVRLADRTLAGVTCIRLDATVTFAHSDKELAEANFKGYGHHPLLAVCDNTGGEPMAWMRLGGQQHRRGSPAAAGRGDRRDPAAVPAEADGHLRRGRGQSRPGQAPGHAGRPPRVRADVLGRVGAERAGEDGAAAGPGAGLAGRDRRPRGGPRAPRR